MTVATDAPAASARGHAQLAVDASTPGVDDIVGRIAAVVTDLGAVIDRDLIVVERHGHVTLGSFRGRESEHFISLPFESLIPIDDLVWDESETVSLVDGAETLTDPQRHLLDLHIELWNATNKKGEFRRTHPKVAAASDDNLAMAIRTLRPTFTAADSTQAMLRTRTFGLRGGPGTHRRSVIMPILELADHHPQGAPYRTNAGLLSSQYTFVDDSPVVFVRYGPMRDAMDLACLYGFATKAPLFFVSAPLTVDLGDYGSLTIQREGDRGSPSRWEIGEQGVSVDYLPLHAHDGLFSTVIVPLRSYLESRGMSSADSTRAAMGAVEAILDANEAIVGEILEAATASEEPGARVVIEAAEHQLLVIDAVREGA